MRAIIVAGIGFFTDAYDLFAINMVTSMLGVVYWSDSKTNPGNIPTSSDTAIKVSTSAGTGALRYARLCPRRIEALTFLQFSDRSDLASSRIFGAASVCTGSNSFS